MASEKGSRHARSTTLLVTLVSAAGLLSVLTMAAFGWPRFLSDGCREDPYPACYCEAAAESFIAQPINTWSNLGFIVVGLMIAAVADRRLSLWRDRPNRMNREAIYPRTFAVVAALLGPGSMFKHGSLTHEGGFIDVLSMYVFASLLLAYSATRLFRGSSRFFLGLFVGLCGELTLLQVTVGLWVELTFGLLLVGFVTLEVLVRRRNSDSNPDIRFALGALCCFGVGVAFWGPSMTEGPWCEPDSLFQGHALWHMCSALATGCLFLYFSSEGPVPYDRAEHLAGALTIWEGPKAALPARAARTISTVDVDGSDTPPQDLDGRCPAGPATHRVGPKDEKQEGMQGEGTQPNIYGTIQEPDRLKSFRRSPGRWSVGGAVGLTWLGTLVLCEFALRGLGMGPWTPFQSFERIPAMSEPHPDLGWANRPGTYRYPVAEKMVTLRIGSDGRRGPSGPASVGLFGCSFVFGFGLSDDQVMSAKLEKLRPDLNVVNHGVPGYGTLQATRRHRHLAEPPPVVVYGLLELHEARNVGAWSWLHALDRAKRGQHWVASPAVRWEGEKLRDIDPFGYQHWPLSEHVALVDLFERTRIEWHDRSLGDLPEATVQLILNFRNQVEARNDRFVVALLDAPRRADFYLERLAAEGVDVVDLRHPHYPEWAIPGDGHPDARVHRDWAQKLANVL